MKLSALFLTHLVDLRKPSLSSTSEKTNDLQRPLLLRHYKSCQVETQWSSSPELEILAWQVQGTPETLVVM